MQRSLISLVCLCALGACTSASESPPQETEAQKPAAAEPAQPKAKASASTKPTAADARAAHGKALIWLATQQQTDGSWPASEGGSRNQVGITGLALLALQSDGSTPAQGTHSQAVARGVQWLVGQQDAELGLIGKRVGHSFAYDHAIATLAMCTALKGKPSPELSAACQNAVGFISRMRNPYGAWRYDYPPTGESDTSVTGWMVHAMAAAKDAGLVIDPEGYVGATKWVEEVTDPNTARIGYDAIGSASSRVTGLNDQFPTDRHEAMTASGMLTRMNAGQVPTQEPMLGRHAQLLRKKLPEWDPADKLVDEYYWYFGSVALKKYGGSEWDAWRQSGLTALVSGQSKDAHQAGSWDPVGPWGYAGGRIYATALNALSLSTMI